MSNPLQQDPNATMATVFVGGMLAGQLGQLVPGKDHVRMSRPLRQKPLAHPGAEPEIEYQHEEYIVHPISLQNDDEDKPRLYGIAVVVGQHLSLTGAFEQLIAGYVLKAQADLQNAQDEHKFATPH